MEIRIYLNNLDEMCLGLNMYYAEEEETQCHVTTLGFLFFNIEFIRWFDNE